MAVEVYDITRRKRRPGSIRQTDLYRDFALKKHGAIDADAWVRNQLLSVYTVEPTRRVAVLVETPPHVDLVNAPFYYQMQYAHAQRVILVPYETFFRITVDPTLLTKRLVFIYSVGRCGSTLLSRVLHTVPSMTSLSEPDVYSKLSSLLSRTELHGDEFRRLFWASTSFFAQRSDWDCKKWLAIKFRSEIIKSQQEINRVLPGVKSIFMYRDALAVGESFDRIYGCRHAKSRWLLRTPVLAVAYRAYFRNIIMRKKAATREYDIALRHGGAEEILRDLGHAGYYMLEWVSKVDSYLKLRQENPGIVALRYEDFIRCPLEMTRRILEHCGIGTDRLPALTDAIKADAQEGTRLDKTSGPRCRFDERDRRVLRDFFESHTELRADVILPGTLTCPTAGGVATPDAVENR